MQARMGTLAAQLAPLAARLREERGLVRPISQLMLECTSPDPDRVVRDTRAAVLDWIQKKAGQLPSSAWEGQPFDLVDVGAQRAEAAAIDDYWAARVDDADRAVPRRTWVTEIALARAGDRVLFGVRLLNVTRGEDIPAGRSIPKFVRDVVAAADFRIDDRPIRLDPWLVADDDEAGRLVAFLTSRSRRHPVLVFALPEHSEDPSATVLPVAPLAKATLGAAHIAILTGHASYRVTDLLGKELSVFDQAVRTYWPGVDPDASDPGEHPLALPRRIQSRPDGPVRFRNLLIAHVLRATVSQQGLEEALPPYAKVKQAYRKRQREQLETGDGSAAELLDLAIKENEELQQRLEEQETTYQDLMALAERERDEERGRLHEARARISALAARIDHLETRLAEAGGTENADETPTDFAALDEWARRHLAGRVVLHGRAVRAARKSPFEDVALAFKALLVLRDYYVPMKRNGGLDAKAAYEEALQHLHLEEAPCFTGTGAGQEGDTYFVDFGGRRRELDRHLKGSNSRDPRYGFRLYFFWDDETEQVVVGSLPNHLDTGIT